MAQNNAQTIINEPHSTQALQGTANGLGALPGATGGDPMTPSGGGVLVNAPAGQAALGANGNTPSNAILSNGSGDDGSGVTNGASGNGPYSNLTDSPSVGPGKNFTQTQKAKIYQQT